MRPPSDSDNESSDGDYVPGDDEEDGNAPNAVREHLIGAVGARQLLFLVLFGDDGREVRRNVLVSRIRHDGFEVPAAMRLASAIAGEITRERSVPGVRAATSEEMTESGESTTLTLQYGRDRRRRWQSGR